MDLKALALPFPENQIEWRIARCGKKGNGQVWAKCLAYVSARAIMDRLDEVCGLENWQVHYEFVSASQGTTPGVLATLSIRSDKGEWIQKQDGADQTDIEAFKGGISSALKRAGVACGIGRYLYGLDEGFAHIVAQGTKDARYAKDKEVGEFYWVPPPLPQWALPKGEKTSALPQVKPEEPMVGDGIPDTTYRIDFGKFAHRTLEEVGPDELRNYIIYIEGKAKKDGKELPPKITDFIDRASFYISSFENQEPGSSE